MKTLWTTLRSCTWMVQGRKHKMKTREWTVRTLDTGIARLEDVNFTWGSLFVRGEFYDFLKTFGLLKIDTHIRVEHKSYCVKDDKLYNYLEITNLDTGIKYYGSICIEDLTESDSNLDFYYGMNADYLTQQVRLENE